MYNPKVDYVVSDMRQMPNKSCANCTPIHLLDICKSWCNGFCESIKTYIVLLLMLPAIYIFAVPVQEVVM